MYSNEIVRRDARQDPEESRDMRTKEFEYAWYPISSTRVRMQRDLPNEAWIEPYLSLVRERMEKELSIARHEVALATSLETIHFWRRIIAFFHQELELNSQGEAVWWAASEAEAFVIYGRG
jgi:hypothetical protein